MDIKHSSFLFHGKRGDVVKNTSEISLCKRWARHGHVFVVLCLFMSTFWIKQFFIEFDIFDTLANIYQELFA